VTVFYGVSGRDLASPDELLHGVHRRATGSCQWTHTARASSPSGKDATLRVSGTRVRGCASGFPRSIACLPTEKRTFFTFDLFTALLTHDDPPTVVVIVSRSMTGRAKMLAARRKTITGYLDCCVLVRDLTSSSLDPALLAAHTDHFFMRLLPGVMMSGRAKMGFVLVTFNDTSIEGVLAVRACEARRSTIGATAWTYPCPRFKIDSCWHAARGVYALVTAQGTCNHQTRACGSPDMIFATPRIAMVVTAEGQARVMNVSWRTVDMLFAEGARAHLTLPMQRLASGYRILTGATVSLTQLAWCSVAYLCATALAMQHSARPLPFTRVASQLKSPITGGVVMTLLFDIRRLRRDQIVRRRAVSPPASDHRFDGMCLFALSNTSSAAGGITIQPTLSGVLNLKVLTTLHAHPGANHTGTGHTVPLIAIRRGKIFPTMAA